MSETKEIKLALVDDHSLLRTALASVINGFEDCIVISESENGRELIEQLKTGTLPDIILLDFNMPVMNGLETALWLQKNYPGIHVLMLSMYDSEILIVKLLQAGVKGFLKKNSSPWELKIAIQSIVKTGLYHSHNVSSKLIKLFHNQDDHLLVLKNTLVSEFEIRFLQLTCTELSYKEIAIKMGLRTRTIDALREKLCVKLSVSNRMGLAMFAVRNGLAMIENTTECK